MSTALTLRSVSKTYSTGGHSFKALDYVDLEIEEGRLAVILGPSGAGKSTLLNLIGGMDTPSEAPTFPDIRKMNLQTTVRKTSVLSSSSITSCRHSLSWKM